jgi:glycosyltransferase involved in cell wall biosynthesis
MHKPKVSIITSIYDADDHIESFLEDIIKQTYFEKCELVIVDGASPGKEFSVISKYQEQYSNIFYHRLEEDPGIYGCWNHAIQNSSGQYLTNANVDDRRAYNQIEKFVLALDNSPKVDLAYSRTLLTKKPHETFYENSSGYQIYPTFAFSKETMVKCLPGCQPLWRRTMHQKAGLFDDNYKFAGDWEMWLRAVRNGSRFMMLEGVYGLYYHNPIGLTTDPDKRKHKFLEEKKVFWEYTDVYGQKAVTQYGEYFKR